MPNLVLMEKDNLGMNDQNLLNRLQKKEEHAVYLLYRECFPIAEKYILLNQGTKEDAEDIFQESILILLAKIEDKTFILSSSLKTFTFAICRNLWLKHLRNRNKISLDPVRAAHETDFLITAEELENTEKKWNSLPLVFQRITAHCSRLLKGLFLSASIPDHYKNDHTLRNQKYKCLEQARKVIKEISLTSR